jgi:DNA mismatch repair protein MutL
VQDKIIKRALMDAYAKHIPSNEYPFAVLMLATQPGVVDINVRPDKSEVKFANPQHVYQMVYGAIGEVLGSEQ